MSVIAARKSNVPSRSTNPRGFEDWCKKELSRLLKFAVEEELIIYLLSIQSAKDVEEYLEELLGSATPPMQRFLRDFRHHWCPPERVPLPPSREEGGGLLTALVRPKAGEMILFSQSANFSGQGGEGGTRGGDGGGKRDAENPIAPPSGLASCNAGDHKPLTDSEEVERGGGARHSSRPKFVPLVSTEGKSLMAAKVPGRCPCQCLGQKHNLVNNCLECGRIVCIQVQAPKKYFLAENGANMWKEGSGPCLFCGAIVCTAEEEELFARTSKKAQKQKEKLLQTFDMKDGERALEHLHRREGGGEGLDRALHHKAKLLEFDQSRTQRSRVIDDELDYYSVDSNWWLSRQERSARRRRQEDAMERKHGSRKDRTVTLDFAGRKVVEETGRAHGDRYDDEDSVAPVQTHAGGLYNPHIPVDPPRYVFPEQTSKGNRPDRVHRSGRHGDDERLTRASGVVARLQDRVMQEMRDEGQCLSMHQPWASLLVEGIKTVEGRSWYTTHRGRLWIAAAAKEPSAEEIREVEDFYTTFYGDRQVFFPSDYPTSCLLGSVDVIDCLAQEDYQEMCPGGGAESKSAYVLLCEHPQELTVKFSIKGQHKIWKLPTDIHASAKRGCRPSCRS